MLKQHDSSVINPDDDEKCFIDSTGNGGETAKAVMFDAGNATSSEAKPDTEVGVTPLPRIMRFIPSFWRFDNAPIEATGLSIDMYARGHIAMSSLFLGPALLDLAKVAAQANCGNLEPLLQGNDDNIEENEPQACKIYGFLPSSLLSNIAVFSGILGSLSMPFIGAVVDHTPFRRQVAAASAIALAVVKGIEVFVGPDTWFMVAILQVVSYILFDMHTTAAYAYTTELTDDHNRKAQYNASYNVVSYVSMLVFLIQVSGISYLLDTEDLGTARISQTITSVTALVCFFVAWKYLFRDRPASSQVPQGRSLWTCGFTKVWDTSHRIVQYCRPLMWATIAMMFAEAAMTALTTIATTYLKEVLEMSANEIALVFLVVLITGIPGSYLGGYLSVRFASPILSGIICNLGIIVVTTAASFVLTGPETKHMALLFSSLWGIGLGWLGPVDLTIFMNLMPNDSRTEFMGIMTLATDILSFLPAPVFTVLNEAGFNMAWGLASLNLFFASAILCWAQIGDYDLARTQASSLFSRRSTVSYHSADEDASDRSSGGQEIALTSIRKVDEDHGTDLP